LWALALSAVLILPLGLPAYDSGSFYSSAMVDPVTGKDFLSVFIPANVFSALAQNHVPAIIVFCVCAGAGLATVKQRQVLITQLDVVAAVLLRVAGFIAKLAPIGVFAIAAGTAGTISLQDAGRLQAYLLLYCFGALLLGLVVLPLLVTSFTPLRYGQVLRIVREPMITAFATGKLIIVLPMLIENTEKLLAEAGSLGEDDKHELELVYTTAYAFPHTGKLLTMLFIPFASWFLGSDLKLTEYPPLLLSGLAAHFGGPIVAIPYLLDQTHLPHDMFQLFLLTGVLGERIGDSIGAMHLGVLALVVLAIMRGSIDVRLLSVTKFLASAAASTFILVLIASSVLNHTAQSVESKSQVIARMQLIERPVESTVLPVAEPNPVPRNNGETVIQRVRRRGVLRVGYSDDKLPFAFFNERQELVGFDVNLAHALAHDLGVTVEFVHFDRATVIEQLRQDHFDLIMSGLVGTLERSEAMHHSDSYMDVTLGLVVPDYRVRHFKSLDSIRQIENLRIGFVDLSQGFVSRLKREIPDVQLVEIGKNRDYFERDDLQLDALLISAESGSAFTLLYPEQEVAIPTDLEVKLPLFYAIAGNDIETRNFLNHWIELRKKDGTFEDFYHHWILGKTSSSPHRRWCLLRDVLHWLPEK
ncbi:MAG: cation:dicarboxylase symporter family transporter, partial [Pirellulales bacterium]|nr:cation:dicarboxylase symporter family transporter [Pirellulales bacterium]